MEIFGVIATFCCMCVKVVLFCKGVLHMTKFSVKIKELRKENDMSQKQLAELLQVDRSTISGWETKDRMPDILLLIKIADTFDQSIDALVGRKI